MRLPMFDRRRFLKGVGSALAAVMVPRPLLVRLGRSWEPAPPIQDTRLRDLTARALEAARAAGATYADVRLTHTRTREFEHSQCRDGEDLHAGVRTLVKGYWGFVSASAWDIDEMARLGQEAVHQARANALGQVREVDLAPAPAVPNGHWVMPVERDPFEVSPLEIMDFLEGLSLFAHTRAPRVLLRREAGLGAYLASFRVQEKAFASSIGTYCTQQLYDSFGEIGVGVRPEDDSEQVLRGVHGLTHAGMGWELFAADRIPRVREHPVREEIRRAIEDAEEDLLLPWKPVDVGRYDVVLDAASVLSFVAGTLAPASELDRSLGYEANADGTTYVRDPFHMLGTMQLAAPMLTLTADRSTPGGVATVQWDDEGVVPDEITLVKDGVLNDFQTVRESAGWLKASYAALGRSWRSHGCANAASATAPPMQFAANLAVVPGTGTLDYEDLVAGTTKGIAVEDGAVDMDFQASSGKATQGRIGSGIYKIERGKKVARLASAALLCRATEFWKSLQALGGEASLRRYGAEEHKGEPQQECFYSVTTPPAAVKGLALVDERRKA